MEKFKLFLVAFVLFSVMISCSKGPEKLLVQKWKLTNIEDPNITDDLMKQEMFSKVIFVFSQDGKYEITGLKEGGDSGTWELGKDGKTVSTKSTDGEVDVSNIIELTADKMVLEQDGTKLTFSAIK